MLMNTVQLPSVEAYDTEMVIHNSTVKKDISLAKEFQKHLLDPSRKNSVMGQGCSSSR